MKIGNVQYTFNPNPTLHYKLDPGEPGIASPTPASQSVGKVAAHELTNLRRFKREAAEEGGIVVQSSIFLNLQPKGAFLAAASGKSKARVLIPEKQHTPEPLAVSKPVQKDKSDLRPDALSEVKLTKIQNEEKQYSVPGQLASLAPDSRIAREQTSLEEEKSRIKLLLNNSQQFPGKWGSMLETDEDNFFLAKKLDQVEARLSYLEQLDKAEKMKELFTDFSSNRDISLTPSGLRYPGAEETAGNLVNIQA